MNYLVYDADGRITQRGSCPDDPAPNAFSHFPNVLLDPPADFGFDTHYVANGAVHAIPAKPTANHVFDYATKAWKLPADALDKVKTAKKESLRATCRSTIVGGFVSSALGAPHLYPSNETDQGNLIASVTASLYPGLPGDWTTPFLCADAAGTWTYRNHTAAQIQQVGADGKAAILGKLVAKAQKHLQVDAAASIEAVEEIAWA